MYKRPRISEALRRLGGGGGYEGQEWGVGGGGVGLQTRTRIRGQITYKVFFWNSDKHCRSLYKCRRYLIFIYKCE
jgi:hypothetical protein